MMINMECVQITSRDIEVLSWQKKKKKKLNQCHHLLYQNIPLDIGKLYTTQ